MKLTKEQVKEVLNSVFAEEIDDPSDEDMRIAQAFFDLGAKMEREECARVAELFQEYTGQSYGSVRSDISCAIRARGQQ